MSIWPKEYTDSPYWTKCPPEFQEHWGRCFSFNNNPMAWIDAEKYCWTYSANLASIHDQGEYDFLYHLMNQYGHYGPAWIGASDAVRAGDWLWSDGSVFEEWGPPLKSAWFRWRRCASISSNDDNTVSRQYCEVRLPFFCGVRPGLC